MLLPMDTRPLHTQRLLLAAAMTRVFARRVPDFNVDAALENLEDVALDGYEVLEASAGIPMVGIPLRTLTQLAERCATIAATPGAVERDPALVSTCAAVVDLLVDEIDGRRHVADLTAAAAEPQL